MKAYIANITGFDAQIADDSTDGYPRPKIKATLDRHETIAEHLKGAGIKFRTEHDGLARDIESDTKENAIERASEALNIFANLTTNIRLDLIPSRLYREMYRKLESET